jgi:choline kinase
VIGLGKKVVPESWQQVGEGVGFFKCGAEAGPELVRRLEQIIREGDGLNEYEDALHLLVGTRHVGWVDVTGLPWTEIDFAEDLRRARDEVLPRIVRLDGA